MIFAKWYNLLIVASLFCVACSTGHCRRDDNKVLEPLDPKPPTGYQQEDLGSLVIAKPDGSLQCGMRVGHSLKEMAAEDLKGVEIISAEKKNDGLMRIQACGTETGMLNTYEIKHQDLRKAQKAGFTVLKTEKKDQ